MNKALIIIDIQLDYFENGLCPLVNPDIASLNAKYILNSFREDNSEIIHIQHIAVRQGSTFFLPDTKGCAIHSDVEPVCPEKIIVKHYPNSFHETELLSYLKERNITDLVICGMMTHMCVDSTTRAAKDFGFNCMLIGDACATKNLVINGKSVSAAEVHDGFLAALNGFYSIVKTTQQYLKQK